MGWTDGWMDAWYSASTSLTWSKFKVWFCPKSPLFKQQLKQFTEEEYSSNHIEKKKKKKFNPKSIYVCMCFNTKNNFIKFKRTDKLMIILKWYSSKFLCHAVFVLWAWSDENQEIPTSTRLLHLTPMMHSHKMENRLSLLLLSLLRLDSDATSQ